MNRLRVVKSSGIWGTVVKTHNSIGIMVSLMDTSGSSSSSGGGGGGGGVGGSGGGSSGGGGSIIVWSLHN